MLITFTIVLGRFNRWGWCYIYMGHLLPLIGLRNFLTFSKKWPESVDSWCLSLFYPPAYLDIADDDGEEREDKLKENVYNLGNVVFAPPNLCDVGECAIHSLGCWVPGLLTHWQAFCRHLQGHGQGVSEQKIGQFFETPCTTLYIREGAEYGQDVQEEDDEDCLAGWLGTVPVRTNDSHVPVIATQIIIITLIWFNTIFSHWL